MLKNIYYPQSPWSECYRQISPLFTILKKNTRVFFPDLDNNGLLQQLLKWPLADIKDAVDKK